MPLFYLKRASNVYSDAGDYPFKPALRDDGEWIEGIPSESLQGWQSLTQKLSNLFKSRLSPEQHADLSILKMTVKFELEQNRPEVARLIIQNAKLPEGLEEVRQIALKQFSTST